LSPAIAWSQDDENPFGDAPAAPRGAERPAAVEAPTRRPTAPAKDDPVITQLRESNPTSLNQLTRAVGIAVDLNQLGEFKTYAKRWLALKPSDANLAALQQKYGSDFFMELSRRDDLRPEGAQIANRVFDGAARFQRDPARLSEMVSNLSATDGATRRAALRGLKTAGDAGIVALIQALADDTFKADRIAVSRALVALQPDSVQPVLAALTAPSADVRAAVIDIVRDLEARQATTQLLGMASVEADEPDAVAAREALAEWKVALPAPAQVSKLLEQRIRSLLAGEVPGELDENDQVGLWYWNRDGKTVGFERFPRQQAALMLAARFAGQLKHIAKDSALVRLALLVQLEADQTQAGLDATLPQDDGSAWSIAQAAGAEVLQATLADALKLDRPTAALALLQVLGATGRPELLHPVGTGTSAIVTALGYPDVRVQAAALRAIIELDPPESFPGASRVVETMQYLLSASGTRRVLVAHARFGEAARIGALYTELGFEYDAVTNGRALIREAQANADYEILLVSETIANPPIEETLQTLRKDPRTARIPVGVLEHFVVLDPKYALQETKDVSIFKPASKPDDAPESAAKQATDLLADERHAPQRLTGGHAERAVRLAGRAVVVPSPQDPAGLRFIHNRVVQLDPTRYVSPERRLEEAYNVLVQAGELLARKQRPAFYDFGRLEPAVKAAADSPVLSVAAAKVLGQLATPQAQAALAEQASLSSRSPEERDAAVAALAQAVERRGVLLTLARIEQQYALRDRAQGAEDRAYLDRVLEIIEAPTAEERQAKQKLRPVRAIGVPDLIPYR
jgi:hypothetical protein